MNTRITYHYRDGDNYKASETITVVGLVTYAEMKPYLDEDAGFCPEDIGIPHPGRKLSTWPSEADHGWCTFDASDFAFTDDPGTIQRNVWLWSFQRAHACHWPAQGHAVTDQSPQLEVSSSNATEEADGDIAFCLNTQGDVVEDRYDYSGGEKQTKIVKFDIAEYEKFYGQTSDSFDILDVGFWDEVGEYEEASEDFREEFLRMLSEDVFFEDDTTMEVYDVTLKGFDGTSDTDHLVKWIKSPGYTALNRFLHEIGIRSEHVDSIECLQNFKPMEHKDGVDVILNADGTIRSQDTVTTADQWIHQVNTRIEQPCLSPA